jgi:hypothetical protein
MNKKAASISTVASIVLLLTVMIVLVIFLLKTRAFANNIVEDSDCKKDIMSHVTLLKVSGEAIAPNIYCPTKYYTLAGKNDADTKQQLAEALKTCWGTWGKGQLDLFKDEGYYCHMCSVIDFKDKNEKITDFNQYLANTPIKAGEKTTYTDYLAGYASEGADPEVIKAFQEKGSTQVIDTSKTYATIFLYAKGKSGIKKFLEGMDALGLGTTGRGITTGLITGVVIGIAASSTGVGIVVGLIGVVAGGIIGFTHADDVQWTGVTLFSEYNKDSLKKIGCQISLVKQAKDTTNN